MASGESDELKGEGCRQGQECDRDTKIGPLELSVKDRERVNIPVWAGVAAIVAGGAVLLVPRKSRA